MTLMDYTTKVYITKIKGLYKKERNKEPNDSKNIDDLLTFSNKLIQEEFNAKIEKVNERNKALEKHLKKQEIEIKVLKN
jgi:hypothetical protein